MNGRVAAMIPLPQTRYRPTLVLMHWLTLLLLAGVYATMELRGMFPRGSGPRELMKQAHYFLGLSVFALTWLRLSVRLVSPSPPIRPRPPLWQSRIATGMAIALYALLLAMPVLGYLLLNADGTAPTLGGMALPRLIGERPALVEPLEEWHELVANLGYALVGLHALAALYHHYVRHDDTLLRMSLRRG